MSEKKYVPEGAFLICDKGTLLSKLTATFHEEVSIYGKNLITKADKGFNVNFTSFGACACNQGKPCMAQVATSEWSSLAEDVFIGDNEPILEDAELQCALGGKIRIFLSMKTAYAALPNGEEQERSFWQSYLSYGKGFYKGLWKGVKGTAVGMYELAIWTGKHSTPYQLINPQGYREQLGKDVETAKSLFKLAVKGTKWAYRRSGYNMLANPDDYMEVLKEDAKTSQELIEKAKQMSAEEIGEVAGQVSFEVGLEVATAGAGAALTAVKIADKTVDVARAVDKLEDMADIAKAAETIEDGAKLPPVPEELGAVVNERGLRPEDFGISMLADNPELLKIWNDVLRDLINSKRPNRFKKYLENLENGVEMNNDYLRDTYKYVRERFKVKANTKGHIIEGEIHHWNYPKYKYPDQITNPKNLTQPINRDLHEAIHEATSSGTNKMVEPIKPIHKIKINSSSID